jgi:hypothetical protein
VLEDDWQIVLKSSLEALLNKSLTKNLSGRESVLKYNTAAAAAAAAAVPNQTKSILFLLLCPSSLPLFLLYWFACVFFYLSSLPPGLAKQNKAQQQCRSKQ